MALIITPTEEKKIYLQGTTIEISQVYNRLGFNSNLNGVSMELSFYTFLDKNMYLNKTLIYTDIPTNLMVVNIDPSTQTQSLESAHELAKQWYESLGYDVTIDLS